MPRLIHEQPDKNWSLASPQMKEARLDNSGFVRSAGFLYRLRVPDDVKLATLYSDSKLYMDLLLRGGYTLTRSVGSDSVKVTSLGKAVDESNFTDNYGRTWQIKVWAVPFDDASLVTMNLPTPEGYAALLMLARSSLRDAILDEQKMLTNFTYVTLEGTLARWREYLPLKASQPKALASLTLDVGADYTRLHIAAHRFALDVTPEILPMAADSVLALNFSYYQDGGSVVWDLGGVTLEQGEQKNNLLNVQRMGAPDASMPEAFQNGWKKALAGEFPFNGVAVNDNGGMKAAISVPSAATAPASPEAAKLRYNLTVRDEGAPGQDAVRKQLDALVKGFKPLEH